MVESLNPELAFALCAGGEVQSAGGGWAGALQVRGQRTRPIIGPGQEGAAEDMIGCALLTLHNCVSNDRAQS